MRCGTPTGHPISGHSERTQCCGQAAAVGRGDVLDSAGEALPEVKAVADLQGIRGAGGDSLPVGEGPVAAGDPNSWVFAEPAAKSFRVASFPEGEWKPGGGVDQEGSVDVAVESEVVHPTAPGA